MSLDYSFFHKRLLKMNCFIHSTFNIVQLDAQFLKDNKDKIIYQIKEIICQENNLLS